MRYTEEQYVESASIQARIIDELNTELKALKKVNKTQAKQCIMEGYKTHRHVQNPKEKELHDNFLKNHNRKGYEDMDLIVFGHGSQSMRPNDYLSDREKKIVLSTIQWLGSPVGKGFLRDCGFDNAT
jgi:cupin superfamily acireductone dioxygenase involved in methionine salvage